MRSGPATCEKCGAEIAFAVTRNGKRQPVDLEPRPDGNLALHVDHLGQLRVRTVTAEHTIETYERPGVAHFATCPGRPGEQIARTRAGAVSLADARRKKAARTRNGGRL